jgi:hypothetical protein
MEATMTAKQGKESSELDKTIQTFQKLITIMEEHSEIIIEKVCLLQNIREESSDLQKTENEPMNGFVGEFRICSERMKKIIDTLEQTKNGLTLLVG